MVRRGLDGVLIGVEERSGSIEGGSVQGPQNTVVLWKAGADGW